MERVARLQDGINEFCVAGEWRRTPYAPRQYEAVQTYVPGAFCVCKTLRKGTGVLLGWLSFRWAAGRRVD